MDWPSEGIVCIDGPAGAGKTTLAAGAPGTVIHADELLDGWGGLLMLHQAITPLVRDLAAGREATYRRFDWESGTFAEIVPVSPAGLVVIEGVGSWNPAVADDVALLIWVDAPVVVRHQRAVQRGDFADQWDAWARDEAVLFARDRTREHADLVIETA